jgi:serine/threonine-protein kinase
MNDSISGKQACKLSSNQIITGKWKKTQYEIIRELGCGATGSVYLARSARGLSALKISDDSMAITSEVNVLRQISRVQGPSLGPHFYETDDFASPRGILAFYTMEYIKGTPFLAFVRGRGPEWAGILTVQLLKDLHFLHKQGWIFGDLKPENLLAGEAPYHIRWIDPGGITKEGRSIKEYTEFFDRGYWGLGDRKAEASYDLFSVSMLLINTAYPGRFEKTQEKGTERLLEKVRDRERLAPYLPVIRKGLEGKYGNALEMREELLLLLQNASFKNVAAGRGATQKKMSPESRQKRRQAAQGYAPGGRKASRWSGVLESLVAASFLLILYILYLVGQTV